MTKKRPVDPEKNLAFELSMMREHRINEPSVSYKVGDFVIHGAVKESRITEVLDGGRILRLHEICTDGNYGKPFDYERDCYTEWHNVIPFRKWKDSDQRKREKFWIQMFNTSVSGLIHRYHCSPINMDPPYQRGFVWGKEDKKALIESIFDDVDIGKFVLRKLPFSPHPAPHSEIVDGKQRLSALVDFYEGRFMWRGSFFRDLHPQDQNHFEGYQVSLGELSEDSTDEQVLRCFLRLNTSGKSQDPSHLDSVRVMLDKEKGGR
jgi:hypothetical protein